MIILGLLIIIVYVESVLASVCSVIFQSEIPMYKFLVALFGTFIVVREILKDKVEKISDCGERERTREKYSKYISVLAVVTILLVPFAFLVSEEGGGYDNLKSKKTVEGENTTTNYYSTSSSKSTSSYSSTTSSATSKRDKCGEDGCSREKGNNGTIYCDLHGQAYVREQGGNDCLDSSCYRSRSGSGLYCYLHTCEWNDCTSKKQSESDYCSTHQRELEEARASRKQATRTTRSNRMETTTEFDADDHDVEGYYEDNRDYFDSYEDAYDAFEDDESAWEDY